MYAQSAPGVQAKVTDTRRNPANCARSKASPKDPNFRDVATLDKNRRNVLAVFLGIAVY